MGYNYIPKKAPTLIPPALTFEDWDRGMKTDNYYNVLTDMDTGDELEDEECIEDDYWNDCDNQEAQPSRWCDYDELNSHLEQVGQYEHSENVYRPK